MSNKSNKTIGNFHKPYSDLHPKSSIGNQPIWDNVNGKVKQVGSIEYMPNYQTKNFDLKVFNTDGNKITDL